MKLGMTNLFLNFSRAGSMNIQTKVYDGPYTHVYVLNRLPRCALKGFQKLDKSKSMAWGRKTCTLQFLNKQAQIFVPVNVHAC